MAGKFPIVEARQELGVVPTTAVRADIDTRTGAGLAGAAIGQATITGIELYRRKIKMEDALVRDEAIQIRKSADLEIELFRTTNADTRLWSGNAEAVFSRTDSLISALQPSRRMGQTIQVETMNWRSQEGARLLVEELTRKKTQTKTVMIDEIIEAYRVHNPEKIKQANENFNSNARAIFSPTEAEIVKRNAITAGFKGYFEDRAGKDAEGTIAILNKEIEARKTNKGKIPEEVMTNSEVRDSISVAQVIMKESTAAFENTLNDTLVKIDNTPELSQNDFNQQAKLLKTGVLAANIPGTQKKRILEGLEKWRRGTNEIDYAKVLSLNQEMDAAQRSGIVDPTIKDRIVRASLEGSFGGRNKGGQKTYGDMIRRFEKLQFDERAQAISVIVRTFERENADDPRLVFLFHQAKNKILAESPDATMRDLFVTISALANVYGVLPEAEIIEKMTRPEGEVVPETKPLIKTEQGVGQGAIPSVKQLKRDLKVEQVTAKPRVSAKRVVMQGPEGRQLVIELTSIGNMLDKGLQFPPGSNVRVKRNALDGPVNFEGLIIEPGKRVISFDGGKTWQLLP